MYSQDLRTESSHRHQLLQSRIALSETYFQVPSTVPAVLMAIPSLDPIAHHDTSSGLPEAEVRFPVTWVVGLSSCSPFVLLNGSPCFLLFEWSSERWCL